VRTAPARAFRWQQTSGSSSLPFSRTGNVPRVGSNVVTPHQSVTAGWITVAESDRRTWLRGQTIRSKTRQWDPVIHIGEILWARKYMCNWAATAVRPINIEFGFLTLSPHPLRSGPIRGCAHNKYVSRESGHLPKLSGGKTFTFFSGKAFAPVRRRLLFRHLGVEGRIDLQRTSSRPTSRSPLIAPPRAVERGVDRSQRGLTPCPAVPLPQGVQQSYDLPEHAQRRVGPPESFLPGKIARSRFDPASPRSPAASPGSRGGEGSGADFDPCRVPLSPGVRESADPAVEAQFREGGSARQLFHPASGHAGCWRLRHFQGLEGGDLSPVLARPVKSSNFLSTAPPTEAGEPPSIPHPSPWGLVGISAEIRHLAVRTGNALFEAIAMFEGVQPLPISRSVPQQSVCHLDGARNVLCH